MDHTNHLAVNSRLLIWRQKKHCFQTCCGEHVEQTIDNDIPNSKCWGNSENFTGATLFCHTL